MTTNVKPAVNELAANEYQTNAIAFGAIGDHLAFYGKEGLRYTVAGVLGWIGAMKFTAYEAGAIQGLVASSPLTSWLYDVFTLQGAANLIGSIEIATAILIVAGSRFPKAALAGALGAVSTFLVTLSYLFTAPGWEASLGGFPALSVVPGQFLLKDAVLLVAAIWLAGDALKKLNPHS